MSARSPLRFHEPSQFPRHVASEPRDCRPLPRRVMPLSGALMRPPANESTPHPQAVASSRQCPVRDRASRPSDTSHFSHVGRVPSEISDQGSARQSWFANVRPPPLWVSADAYYVRIDARRDLVPFATAETAGLREGIDDDAYVGAPRNRPGRARATRERHQPGWLHVW